HLARARLDGALQVSVVAAERDERELAVDGGERLGREASGGARGGERTLGRGAPGGLELRDELAAQAVERAHRHAAGAVERELERAELEGRAAETTELLLGQRAVERRAVRSLDRLVARDLDGVAEVVRGAHD